MSPLTLIASSHSSPETLPPAPLSTGLEAEQNETGMRYTTSNQGLWCILYIDLIHIYSEAGLYRQIIHAKDTRLLDFPI